MKKTITPKLNKDVRPKTQEVVAPSDQTLDFLRLFARTYYVDKSLPSPINEVCVN